MVTKQGRRHALVIGAGWAGLTAALRLQGLSQGAYNVSLVERQHYAGGRAFSFYDDGAHEHLDNGQHVLLGCCTRVPAFVEDIGLSGVIQFQPLLRIPVFADQRWATLGSTALPGPLHLLPSLLRYQHLSIRHRLRALSLAPALMGNSKQQLDNQLDNMTFANWLSENGQSSESIRRLWDLVGVSVLNTHAQQASAQQAIRAFQMGVVNGSVAARLGYFRIPLGAIGKQALQALEAQDVDIQMGKAVSQLVVEEAHITGVQLQDGTFLKPDVVVAALPPAQLLRIIPEAMKDHEYFRDLTGLSSSSILNINLLFKEPVMKGELAAFTEGLTQFVFNRGRLLGRTDLDGRWLVVSVSAANPLRSRQKEDLISTVLRELSCAWPGISMDQVLAVSSVWQPQATILQAAGTGKLRRDCRTPIDNLFLAGDWTNTGWPASLEGAVRSGETASAAANQVLH